jgi:segregation and condensation protein A
MLLPSREDEENDPRRELMMSLLGYKTCRAMAQKLRERSSGFDCFVRDQQPLERDALYTRRHEPGEIADAFLAVKGRVKRRQPPPVTAFRGVVGRSAVSVASRVVHVIKRLLKSGPSRVGALYADARGRSELVATFLALLELIRSGRITTQGENGEETVEIVRGGR